MQLRDNARLPICADLYTQTEQPEHDCRAMTLPVLHEAIDEIRSQASNYNLVALEGIAHAFECRRRRWWQYRDSRQSR